MREKSGKLANELSFESETLEWQIIRARKTDILLVKDLASFILRCGEFSF